LGSILGAGLGSLVGRIGGAIGGLFRNEEIEKLNDMRDAFFEAHGGWQAFAQEMERAGQEDWAGKIFRAKTVEEFNALVRESQDILSAQGESQQALNDAVERYGFTIDELGPKWKQQELDKMAAQLLKDYRLLVASGIDVTTVIERMGPAFSQYVDTALAAGVAIPESMRATIDALFQQGKLVHENGEAFTEAEYKSLSFTESMTESLSRATAAIERLVAALTGVPANVSTTVTTHHRNEYDGRPGADPFAYHDGSEMPQYAAGISRVPRDGMAYLHRDERVVPASENMGGDGAMAAELAAIRRQLEQQPNDIARAVRDALQRV
jgi:hypothetical protein